MFRSIIYLPEVSPFNILEYTSKSSSKLIVLIDFEKLEKSVKIISLEELLNVYPKMLKGETSGRYLVDLNK